MEKGAKKRTTRSAKPRAKACSFQLTAPEADTIAIAGDFNSWDTQANPLKKDKAGVWKVTLRLQPGSYQYKFVVNGAEWREDPANPDKVLSSLGTFNSVCEVL
jgi:1,4-alpha-glucan branching enzyme